MKKFFLILLLSTTVVASPDPLLSKEKEGYVKRCSGNLKSKGLDPWFQKAFCTCMVNHIEAADLKTLSSPYSANRAIASQCIRTIKKH